MAVQQRHAPTARHPLAPALQTIRHGAAVVHLLEQVVGGNGVDGFGAAAERLTDAIFTKAALLESQPLLGRVVPEAERPDVRELFYQKYRLIYRVVSETEILTLHPALRPLAAGSLLE